MPRIIHWIGDRVRFGIILSTDREVRLEGARLLLEVLARAEAELQLCGPTPAILEFRRLGDLDLHYPV